MVWPHASNNASPTNAAATQSQSIRARAVINRFHLPNSTIRRTTAEKAARAQFSRTARPAPQTARGKIAPRPLEKGNAGPKSGGMPFQVTLGDAPRRQTFRYHAVPGKNDCRHRQYREADQRPRTLAGKEQQPNAKRREHERKKVMREQPQRRRHYPCHPEVPPRAIPPQSHRQPRRKQHDAPDHRVHPPFGGVVYRKRRYRP